MRWLESEPWPPWFDRLTLMFQREVARAHRRHARRSARTTGGSRCSAAGGARARILFDVPAAAFTPPPKVTSSVVELVPRRRPCPASRACSTAVTASAFGQRRKMLRQSLKSFAAAIGVDPAALLGAAGVEPTRRAEEIDVAGFVALARAAQTLRRSH